MPERVGSRNGHALPLGGRLVGQVADAGGERKRRVAGHRLDVGELAARGPRAGLRHRRRRPAFVRERRRSSSGRIGHRPRPTRAGRRSASPGAGRRQRASAYRPPARCWSRGSALRSSSVCLRVQRSLHPDQGRRLDSAVPPWFGPACESASLDGSTFGPMRRPWLTVGRSVAAYRSVRLAYIRYIRCARTIRSEARGSIHRCRATPACTIPARCVAVRPTTRPGRRRLELEPHARGGSFVPSSIGGHV